MITDHIKFFKEIVEENITDRAGTGYPLAKKFFEIYPEPSTIIKSVPCAALRNITSKQPVLKGVYDSITADETTIKKTKQLYETYPKYQVDLYSKDIYDFFEKDGTYKGYLTQLIELIANNQSFTGADGISVSVTCGLYGVIDDKNLIVDGIYKAYCQVHLTDGIYKDITVPRITAVNFSEGEVRDE